MMTWPVSKGGPHSSKALSAPLLSPLMPLAGSGSVRGQGRGGQARWTAEEELDALRQRLKHDRDRTDREQAVAIASMQRAMSDGERERNGEAEPPPLASSRLC